MSIYNSFHQPLDKVVKNRTATLTAAAAILAARALDAAPLNSGWYVSGGGGANWQTNGDIDLAGVKQDTERSVGWIAALSSGYAWRNGVRLELEFAYRENGFDSVASLPAHGDARLMSGMVNAVFAFPTPGPVAPYFGVGLGAGHLKLESVRPLGPTSIDDSNTGFAAQAIAGVEYAVTDRLGLNVSYRYMYMPSLDLTAANGSPANIGYEGHAILVSLRWSFGAPVPVVKAAGPALPPPPAPQPPSPPVAEAPRSYTVFFGWNSAALTPDARIVVQTAAQSAREGRITRIELDGYADRSGPDAYNLGLSERRADAVKAELVRLGVAPTQITTSAWGERQLLVPTADGVREPQNRRVEIVLPIG
jgi:outer membrane protein OmpA-like peptidoglycan-associated protein